MTKENRDIIFKIALFVITTFLTSWTIKYQYGSIAAIDGKPVVEKWPYIKMAIQISILTFFVGTSLGLLKKLRDLQNSDEGIKIHEFVIIFFFGASGLHLLYYPGLNQLGLESDATIFPVIVALNTIQTIFFYLILKLTINEKVKLTTYIILFIIAVAVLLISPFFSGGGNRYFDF